MENGTVTRDEWLSFIDEVATRRQTKLNLSSCDLTELPPEVGKLSDLEWLILSDNRLKSLPESITQLTNLQCLDLSGNLLSDLPESIGYLTELQELNLSGNYLSTFPDIIRQLPALRWLVLNSNQISNLPIWTEDLAKLDVLDLRWNPLPIPLEVLADESNPSKILDFYFSLQAEVSPISLYEAKLIILGEGGAGKTSLKKKIDDENYELSTNEKATEGIDVVRWDFAMADGNIFRTNIWDFGGQEIYHATHQFFLTKRSLYILVADTRRENTDFYYWLNVIELLAASSPVIIVKNEKQDRQCDIDEVLLKGQFNNLKDSLPTNLESNRGLYKVKDAICYHIQQLSHIGDSLPAFWADVRADLEGRRKVENTITLQQYYELCVQHGCTDKSRMLFVSSYLHDLGVCLHFQDDKLLKRTVILKPEWATTAVYKVSDSDTIRQNKGRFTEADTAETWFDSEYSDLRDELLQLMMRFKLAYEIPNQGPNAPGHYIAPQLLPISKPQYDWNSADNLILRYTYDFMPKGILTRFIVETNSRIENQNHVWKNGVILADNWARAEIIEYYPQKEIHIRVSGTNKKPLLEVVRGELWKIHQSYERLKYDELIPCNCAQCKESNKPESYPYELLLKYIGDHRYDIECRASYDKVDVRRLMSDIGDDPMSPYAEEKEVRATRTKSDAPTNLSIGRDIKDSIVIIGNDNNANIELAHTARDIKTLLDELSEEYNPNSAKGQTKIGQAAIAEIKQNSTLKQRAIKALKSAGDEALEQAISHPAAKVVVGGVKGFIEG
ncbi:leucine-rich repeat domain-containing protein [cf. Phormidesmis sp. LEGE 11477]|nr:leucine-rich repeat domain-containing protein [cf. Phormidesmis sp. LEGE 11477]